MQYAVWHRTFLFDPETEICRLEMWFQDNPNPKYELVVQYTDFLNKQPFRNAPNLKLVPENIRVWFKYQRANSDSEEDSPNSEQRRMPIADNREQSKGKGKRQRRMPNASVCRRTLFDPQTEIPRLEMWFQDNRYPRYELIYLYTDILNKQPSRNSPTTQLMPENIKNWFKNRRAKEKRDKNNRLVKPSTCQQEGLKFPLQQIDK